MYITNPPTPGGFNNRGGGFDMWGALIGAGASIGGGLIDHFLNRDASDDAFAKSQHYSQRAIRDRVRDAELAGIHPLYALGASTTTPSPMAFESRLGESISRAGQDVSGAVSRGMDKIGRQRAILENALLNSQILKTDAERNLSEQEFIRLMDQNGTPMSGLLTDTGNPPIKGQLDSGLYQVEPPKRSTHPPGLPGIESGPIQGFQQQTLPGGLNVLLPGSDEKLSDILENVPFWLWPTIWKVNKDHYGEAHTEKLWKVINPLDGMQIFKPSAVQKAKKFKKFFRGLQERGRHQFGNQNVK